jgi:hypothetical protein
MILSKSNLVTSLEYCVATFVVNNRDMLRKKMKSGSFILLLEFAIYIIIALSLALLIAN